MVRCHLANAITRDKCKDHAPTVERLLTERYGLPMRLELLADGDQPGGPAPASPDPATATATSAAPIVDEVIDPSELTDAPVAGTSGVDRLTAAFPGARVVDDDTGAY